MPKIIICIAIFLFSLNPMSAQEAVKKGNIVLGSYHAYYFEWSGLKGFKKNSSVPDFTSQQLGWTLSHGVIEFSPEYCILQTGPEDLMLGISPDRVIENIGKIKNELDTAGIQLIILSGIQNPERKIPGLVNDLNTKISDWCLENSILYIDLSDLVSQSSAFDENFIILPEIQKKIIYRINQKLSENSQD